MEGDEIGMSEVEYIKAQLSETERLLGLTEEALELALAALKLRRVLDGENPTPVTYDQAVSNLLEEYGDLENCIEVLLKPSQHEEAMRSRFSKRSRWVYRLKERNTVRAGERCPFCKGSWVSEPIPDHCPLCGAAWRPKSEHQHDLRQKEEDH